jgi:hypothetical protein
MVVTSEQGLRLTGGAASSVQIFLHFFPISFFRFSREEEFQKMLMCSGEIFTCLFNDSECGRQELE